MKALVTTLAFTLLTLSLNAQVKTDSLVDKYIRQMQAIWASQQTFSSQQDSTQTRLLKTLLSYPVQHVNDVGVYELKLNELKADLYHKDPGLRATAGYLENLDPAPDDDNLIYARRVQAGVTWDILRQGLVSHRYKEKAILTQNEIDERMMSRDAKRMDYLSRWHSIIYMFNQVKVDILNRRKDVVSKQLQYAQEFYRLKLLKREDLLSIQAELAEIEAMYDIYNSYNDQLEPDFPTIVNYKDNIPVFDLNYDLFMSDFNIGLPDSLQVLSDDLLKYRTSAVHDISLRANARYNWYDLTGGTPGNRSFFSLGVTASMPIPFNNKLKKEIEKSQMELEKFKGRDAMSDVQKDLINDAYEYRYKLKQYINFHEKRIRFLELLRQERVLLKLDPVDFNPVKALGLIDDILSIDIELTELNQNMYLKILRIYTKLPAVKPKDVVRDFSMPNYEDREKTIYRSIYLWSADLAEQGADFVDEYLRYNQADQVILAVNIDSSLSGARNAIIESAQKRKVDVQLMIGRNKLIQEGNIETYLANVTDQLQGDYKGIHLDIEPHTFDDWQENKAAYLDKLLDLVNGAKQFCNSKSLKLSMSIPLHYPEQRVKEFLNTVDEVYFMAYENIKVSYIVKKVSNYASYGPKVHLALRTEDFETRLDMERHYDELRAALGLPGFALHDMGSLFELDKRSINHEQEDDEEH